MTADAPRHGDLRLIGGIGLVATTVLMLLLVAGEAERGIATEKDYLTYFVIPHPDDEIFVWSMIADQPGQYPVFLVLTLGEQTGFCGGHGHDPDLGEDAHPWGERWSAECGTARVASFLNLFDRVAEIDEHLEPSLALIGEYESGFTNPGVMPICRKDDSDDGDPEVRVPCTIEDRSYRLHANATAAVMFFNLGDGDLTSDEVRWAIGSARQARGLRLPRLAEHGVVASFNNGSAEGVDQHAGCNRYFHRDHRAAHEAVWRYRYGSMPRWGATCATDPAATLTVLVATREYWDELVGAVQASYGWLRPGPWVAYDTQAEAAPHTEPVLVREQSFWLRRPHEGGW